MRKHSRMHAATLLALSLVLLFSSCIEGSPAGPSFPLVPGDAILAVVVEKPARLFGSLAAFWKTAGIAKVAGGELADLVRQGIPGGADLEKSLDAARPWALAMVPKAPGSKEMRTLVYIPLRGQDPKALGPLAEGKMRVVAQAKGYVVLADEAEEGYKLEFPSAKPLDLAAFARYPAEAVKVWADPVALSRLAEKDWDGFKADVGRFVKPNSPPDPKEALKTFTDGALALLKEIRSADAAVIVGAEGFTLRMGAQAVAGASMEKFLLRAAAAPSALDWAGQVSAESLYGYAWSFDPGVAAELSDLYLKAFLPALGSAGGEAGAKMQGTFEKLAAIQARWYALAGPRGAASLDIDFDAKALKALGQSGDDPKALSAALGKAFSLRGDFFQEVKDEAKYRQLLSTMAKDPELNAVMKELLAESGIKMEIRSADKKDGSFAYGELGFSFEIVDPAKFSQGEGMDVGRAAEAAKAAFEAIAGLFNFRWTTSKGRFVGCFGTVAELKALVDRPAAAKSLAADPAFAAFSKQLPAKVQMLGSLSARRLAALVAKALEGSLPPESGIVIDPKRFGNWYSYLAATGKAGAAGLEFGFTIPSGDVAAVIDIVAAAARQKSGGGGF
ncbi:MAG: hypothetical protein JNG85_03525 [Spirochaetaceae bacterium]|nr:hypothetical protein [Spirochaetaceae bacterium]